VDTAIFLRKQFPHLGDLQPLTPELAVNGRRTFASVLRLEKEFVKTIRHSPSRVAYATGYLTRDWPDQIWIFL
jgi:hypothetical protein